MTHPYHTRPFSEYSKGMNTLSSYNIRNNEEFKNVILNLEKYLVDQEMDWLIWLLLFDDFYYEI